jgi:hypothetical protein
MWREENQHNGSFKADFDFLNPDKKETIFNVYYSLYALVLNGIANCS